jgi:hypothetical protein
MGLKVKLKAFHKPLIFKDNLLIFGLSIAPGAKIFLLAVKQVDSCE